MYFKKLFLPVCLFWAFSLFPEKKNARLSWLNKNIASLLNTESIKYSPTLTRNPPSIGFFSADLKFDGEKLKFCEIGNGLYGVPVPAYSIINEKKELLYTPYWDLFWLFLKQFNLPLLYIGKDATNGIETLHQLGGMVFSDIKKFRTFYTQNYPINSGNFKATKISDFTAIIAYAGARDFDQINKLKADYPNLLFINNFDALFRRQKDKIHEFFNCEELSALRPRWKVYPHSYSSQLAKQIQTDIPTDYYVIKPSIGRKAEGVIMVEKENLDEVLKDIFSTRSIAVQAKAETGNKNKDWKKAAHQSTFIVEEYVPSKTIFYEGKPYDPTLRAAFAVYYDQGKIVSTFFSCFWKKPPYSLNDNVSLTEKHLTKSMIGCTTPGQEVDPDDMKKLAQIFNSIVPTIYEKMLLQM